MKEEIDHEYTKEIVCPYCGYEFMDSWEFEFSGDGDIIEIDCGDCEKSFSAIMDLDVTYRTKKNEDAK